MAGYVLANRHKTFFANAPVIWVEEPMVNEAVRKKGVGRALMAAVESWASHCGAAYVALATRRGHAFYLSLGYRHQRPTFGRRWTRRGLARLGRQR